MYTGKIRQILLITDGCSNQGDDPIAMAALAKEQGITVNVIGVMEQDVIDEKGMNEIEGIAMSGGESVKLSMLSSFRKLCKWLPEKR